MAKMPSVGTSGGHSGLNQAFIFCYRPGHPNLHRTYVAVGPDLSSLTQIQTPKQITIDTFPPGHFGMSERQC